MKVYSTIALKPMRSLSRCCGFIFRHCECNEAIQSLPFFSGLLRFTRNDEKIEQDTNKQTFRISQRCYSLIIPFFFLFFLAFPPVLCAEELQSGLSYKKYSVSDTDADQQIIHVLTIDPKQFTLKSVHAKDGVLGIATVESLARRFNAVAAINGGFFRMGEKLDGTPAGILKIDGRWYGLAYKTRGALGWSKDNMSKDNIMMDRIQTKTNLEIGQKKFKVYGINQPGVVSRAILYTSAYGATTDSPPGAMDIIIQNGTVTDVVPAGKTPIPLDGYVYSIGPKVPRLEFKIAKGDPVKLEIKILPTINKRAGATWQSLDNIVGGIPLLIENGRILKDYTSENISSVFIDRRHARTAFGVLKNDHWIFAVVEKSQNSGSLGMTLPEFSAFLHKLGCRQAVNLDGGTSSTLFANNKVINVPQGEIDENLKIPVAREIADALLILPKVKAN